MKNTPEHKTPESAPFVARSMFLLAGCFFLLCALLYNEFFVALAVKSISALIGRPFSEIPDPGSVRKMQLAFVVFGAVLVVLAQLMTRLGSLERFFKKPRVEKLVLAGLVLLVPVATLELTLRPFAPFLSKSTSLFIRDNDLGWRMRPNAVEKWGEVTVRINGKGLRGPELDYQKDKGVYRILYLGDSVTFGYRLERYQDAYPFVVETMLEAATGREIETINAGVGGYSPWQEHFFLVREGIRYQPDLVVVSFVLNDVTEKFHLERFGGVREGYQLSQSYYSWMDRLLSRSGLGYQVRNITRKIKARRVLGKDVQLGAINQQMLNVENLMAHPEWENVQVAWRITLANLQRISDYCHERDIAVLLVAFPFEVQIHDPARLSAPQNTLTKYAEENGVPCTDLLPVFSRHERKQDLFIDHDHLTVTGNTVAAGSIANKIIEYAWLEKTE